LFLQLTEDISDFPTVGGNIHRDGTILHLVNKKKKKKKKTVTESCED